MDYKQIRDIFIQKMTLSEGKFSAWKLTNNNTGDTYYPKVTNDALFFKSKSSEDPDSILDYQLKNRGSYLQRLCLTPETRSNFSVEKSQDFDDYSELKKHIDQISSQDPNSVNINTGGKTLGAKQAQKLQLNAPQGAIIGGNKGSSYVKSDYLEQNPELEQYLDLEAPSVGGGRYLKLNIKYSDIA